LRGRAVLAGANDHGEREGWQSVVGCHAEESEIVIVTLKWNER